jgi:hypothetical protein
MNTTLRATGQITGLSLIVAPLALVGQSAFATATCQTTTPAATLVAPGVCGVEFTEAGDYTFNAPSGITKLHAVVVAGGASAQDYFGIYGGGGGDVQFFDVVDFDQPIDLTVGAGGQWSSANGDDSILNGDIVPGGWMTNSGNNNSEACDMNSEFFCAGGGAGGDAPSRVDGGAGVLASDVAGNSDLFPEIDGEPEFGAGGDAILDGSSTIEDTPNIPGHGGNAFSQSTGGDGIDGAVYLRWPAPADSLASTGFDVTSGIAAAGAVTAGAAILVATRRRRHN